MIACIFQKPISRRRFQLFTRTHNVAVFATFESAIRCHYCATQASRCCHASLQLAGSRCESRCSSIAASCCCSLWICCHAVRLRQHALDVFVCLCRCCGYGTTLPCVESRFVSFVRPLSASGQFEPSDDVSQTRLTRATHARRRASCRRR